MLKIENVSAYYAGNQALKGVSLEVKFGEIVTLIGSNGAGKTTLLNCISALHPNRSGKILFNDDDVTKADSQKMVRLGIVQIPESRQLFSPLTVQENLEMGAYLRANSMTRRDLQVEIEEIYDRFPVLGKRRKQRAGTLSGGEQQMVAIGRGLMSNPKLLLLDEPSLGLAPLIVQEIFRILQELQNEGRTILLVEQNALAALAISDRGYVLENGHITITGRASELMANDDVRQAFLGQDVQKKNKPQTLTQVG
jgi:branched-chain amino acid transport system ATP-binding protein